jgi:phosphotransferase system enzyme I (PtsP)
VPGSTAARDLLRRLAEVMGGAASAQSKLNQVVRLIAAALDAEVCSIYLKRDGWFELFATRGLAQEAVHLTRLAQGEGLVGHIAQTRLPLNLADARAHPAFAYRPETGEDLFRSFAGVPIVRAEQAVGVLVVQHLENREFEDVEMEALTTVAMVLAELIAAAGLIDETTLKTERARAEGPLRLSGVKLVLGLARGRAVYHQPRIVIEHAVAQDVAVERERIERAFAQLHAEVERMASQAEFAGPGDHSDIIEAYRMFALDEGWQRRILDAVDSGLTAEAAIEQVQQRTRARMRRRDDPFFRERLLDLDDLANRLQRIVAGRLGTAAQAGLAEDTILLARNLGPAELLEYDRRYLKGVLLEEGSLTSHVVIVARAMGVPVLGRVENLRALVTEGDPILLDVDNGVAHVRPPPAIEAAFEATVALRARRQAQYEAIRDLPAVSRDGVRIALMINAGLAEDAALIARTGAEGIGLFRTEFQFLISADLPRRGRQTALYRQVLDGAGGAPVVFRSVDIGGDKAVPYLSAEGEENPAMGWRALRLSLDRRGLMKVQAAALMDAAAGRDLSVMFPMVSEPWEFDAARALFEDVRARHRARGRPVPTRICYGAMLEVPALAEMLDVLLPRLDFLSLGTNDLIQFLFAADRGNPLIADRYDWLSPAVLRFLARVVAACRAHGVPLTTCGEMGGRPLEALGLMAIGIERLSITPAAVGPIKAVVRSASLAPLRAAMAGWLAEGRSDIRQLLAQAAEEQGVALA